MKIRTFLPFLGASALAFALVACSPAPDAAANTQPAATAAGDATTSTAVANVVTAAIKVEGMDCGGCVNTTREAIASLPGFKDMEADVAAQEIKVQFEKDTTQVEQVVAAINTKTDYKAKAL